MVTDIEVHENLLIVKLTVTKGKKKNRSFTITNTVNSGVNYFEIIRKYMRLRPKKCSSQRFLLGYRNGKCTIQPLGKNTVAKFPMRIAEFLDLENADQYTGT